MLKPLTIPAGFKMEIITVTRDDAERILANSPINRRITERHVFKLMKSMISGNWDPYEDRVIFGKDGVLVEGQQRFLAFLKTEYQEMPFIVFRRPDLESAKDLRGNIDKSPWKMSQATGLDHRVTDIVRAFTEITMGRAPTQDECLKCAKVVEPFIEKLFTKGTITSKKFISTANIRAAVILRMAENPDKADLLCEEYGNFIRGGTSAKKLSNIVVYFHEIASRGDLINKEQQFYKAWIAFNPKKFKDNFDKFILAYSAKHKAKVNKSIIKNLGSDFRGQKAQTGYQTYLDSIRKKKKEVKNNVQKFVDSIHGEKDRTGFAAAGG